MPLKFNIEGSVALFASAGYGSSVCSYIAPLAVVLAMADRY